jgi:exonuclease III
MEMAFIAQNSESNKNYNSRNLKIVHWNCNSIKNKIELLGEYLLKYKPHIISLNEIKLSTYEANHLLRFCGYSSLAKCRKDDKAKGGGVAILVRADVAYNVASDFDYLNLELVSIRLVLHGKEITILSYYNPPTSSIESQLWLHLQNSKEDFILCGDLNCRSSSLGGIGSNRNGELLENIILDHDFIILNDSSPTFFRNDYFELLDYMISTPRIASKCIKFKVEENSLLFSDHIPIECWIVCEWPVKENKKSIAFDFSRANWPLFREELDKIATSHSHILDTLDINELNEFFANSILLAADKSIPRKGNISSKRLPANILALIKKRREMKNCFFKDPSLNSKTEINRITKDIKEEIKKIRSDNWIKFLDKCSKSNSTKPFWNKINQVREGKSGSSMPTLKMNGLKYETDQDKANILSRLLRDTFVNTEAVTTEQEAKVDARIEEFIRGVNDTNWDYKVVQAEEVVNVLSHLNAETACGKDGIFNVMLKNISYFFVLILTRMVNLSLSESNLAGAWREAIVSMIPKKDGYSPDPNKYRPISLTSCIGKFVERIVATRLVSYLEEKNILIKQQSGFRKKRGTHDNLLFLTQKIAECFSRGKKCLGIFFDIAKAFDKVWHKGLIFKMIDSKIPRYIIYWTQAFLMNRSFVVRVNNETSESCPILAGVPQGAVLSPILFSIYINDIPIDNKRNSSYSLLFADDLAFINCFKKPGKLMSYVRGYILQIEIWLRNWKLKMSAEKCSYIIFSKSNKNVRMSFRLFGKEIPYDEAPRFLGVYFDERLTFARQVKEIRNKSLQRLNIIKIISHKSWMLNKKALLNTYFCLVRSVLDYSFIINCVISSTNLQILQRVQNRAIRYIFRPQFGTNLTDLAAQNGILRVEERLESLFTSFIMKGLIHNNPLVSTLIKEYKRGFEARSCKVRTCLCAIRAMLFSS